MVGAACLFRLIRSILLARVLYIVPVSCSLVALLVGVYQGRRIVSAAYVVEYLRELLVAPVAVSLLAFAAHKLVLAAAYVICLLFAARLRALLIFGHIDIILMHSNKYSNANK